MPAILEESNPPCCLNKVDAGETKIKCKSTKGMINEKYDRFLSNCFFRITHTAAVVMIRARQNRMEGSYSAGNKPYPTCLWYML